MSKLIIIKKMKGKDTLIKKVNDDFDFKYRMRISSDSYSKVNDESLEIDTDFDPGNNTSLKIQIPKKSTPKYIDSDFGIGMG
jgi:hypothetical protein